jgi:uroporphyrinogen-III decarboxylase
MSAMSHWIDFPVTDHKTWKGIFEERFQPRVDERLPDDWEARRDTFADQSETRWVSFFCFPLFGLFGTLRELMGFPGLLYAMHDDPDLVHTMIEDLTDFWLAVFSAVLSKVRLDQVMFFEDMCATKAPLISPATFREFQAPGYRKVIGGLRELGVQHFFVDTDGNANLLVPELIACGITGLHPCEVQAGMDVAALRDAYPDLCLNAGIDKRVLTQDAAAIDAEVARCMAVAWKEGRYTPALDHGAPPDISWENIQHYARAYREWCERPFGGRDTQVAGLPGPADIRCG